MERKWMRRILHAVVDVAMLPVIVLIVAGCGWAVRCNLFFMGGVNYFMSLFGLYFSMSKGWVVPASFVIWLVFLWANHGIGFTARLWGRLWSHTGLRLHGVLKPLFLMGILTVVSLAVIYGPYLTGKKFFMFSDLGFDTTIQFYPMYIWVIHSIREGSLSLWNFAWGLGCDTLTRQEWLMDPFGILTVIGGLLFGDGAVRHMLIWLQVLKIILAMLFCYKYLSFFNFDWKVKSLVSWMYGFSGYMLLWGEHYYFGAAVVYVVLLLYAVERYLDRQSRGNLLFVSLLTAAIFIYSGYFGYMIVLFGSVYSLVRVGWLGRFWRLLWPLVIAVITGILIAGAFVLPFVELTVSVSSRLSNDLTLLQKLKRAFVDSFSPEYYGALISRLASNNMVGKGVYQDYYEYPQLSFSMMNLIVLPQFLLMWLKNGISAAGAGVVRGASQGVRNGAPKHFFDGKSRLCLQILAVLLVVLSLAFPFASYAFNGFGTISERWTFVLMPLWAYCYAYFFKHLNVRSGVSSLLLIVSLVAVFAVGYWCFWHFKSIEGAELNVNSWILYFNVFCAVGLSLYFLLRGARSVGLTLVILSMVFSVMCEGYVCNVMRTANTDEIMNDAGSDETSQALAWLKEQDSSFYRVEKDYSDLLHASDSFIQGYYPLRMYCSSKSGELIDFYEYIYSDIWGEEPVDFEMDQDMVSKMALANVKYYLSRDEVDYEGLKLINEVAGVRIYENELAASLGTLWDAVIARSDYEALDADGRTDAILKYLVVDDEFMEKMKDSGASVYGDEAKTDGQLQSLTSGGDYTLVSQTCIEGTINNTSGESWLMLSIPWRKGWNVYIDGKKVESLKVDYAFMAVSVDTGEHTVTVRYENPVYVWGVAVSLAGCVMLVAFMLFYRGEERLVCGYEKK